ncbi:MAG: hypothetical protein WBX15_02885 [Thermoanaerobaculia bacterium]
MIRLVCTSCKKPLTIDETKLPMKEVAFPCPACKTRLTIDRRAMTAESVDASAGAAAAAVGVPEHDGFGQKALVVGRDIPQVTEAARAIGLVPTHQEAPDSAREYYLREYPAVVFLVPNQVTPPPLAEMAPVLSVSPQDRRRSFFILVSDNLRTLDGNAAFLYGVNLIVAPKDLASFAQIYHDAETFHRRLYQHMAV